jgi:regulator of protease activity HflC (stomatin/prohibitin superfamily)
MSVGLIALAVIIILFAIVLVRSVRIVPQARAAVVERLGRYIRTQGPGLTLLVPFVDRMRPLMDLREQVVSFPPQPVITSDNLTVAIDSVIYFQVTDPRAATYEIQNYIQAVEQLTITTLRNVVGSLNLEQALTSRDAINTQLRGVLDEATGPWGIRVARVEIKAIDPPPSIQDAMEKQMRADRDKRAMILQSEGQREASIKSAEGQKAAQILSAEGQKQSVILAAEADRQSRILRAEGERAARYLAAQGQAKAIETTFAAIHTAKPDPALLAYQYLQTLPQIAQGDANKMWIVPSEFSSALDGLAKLTGKLSDTGTDQVPAWLNTGPTVDATEGPGIDTSGWFDSNVPPAAELPEAMNLRASDSDPDSLEAHSLLPDGSGSGGTPTPPPIYPQLPPYQTPTQAPPPRAQPPRSQPAQHQPAQNQPPQHQPAQNQPPQNQSPGYAPPGAPGGYAGPSPWSAPGPGYTQPGAQNGPPAAPPAPEHSTGNPDERRWPPQAEQR